MRDVVVLGVGMTHFGKRFETGIKQLVREAVEEAITDAGLASRNIEAAYMANSLAGHMTGQHMIRGQVTLIPMSLSDIPVYNVENACASSSTAFNLAWQSVACGAHDCVLVAGFEKLFHPDKQTSFEALKSGYDVAEYQAQLALVEQRLSPGEPIFREAGSARSPFMDVYAFLARRLLDRYGLTQQDLGLLAVKAHKNGAQNPKAQYQREVSVEQVMESGDVSFPLTRMMCAPVGDGGSAAILCSAAYARKFTSSPVWVKSSIVSSGRLDCDLEDTVTSRTAAKLYEHSGIGPEDIDLVELHDTTSAAEIGYLVELGLCSGEQAADIIHSGALEINGSLPCNPSGGLTTKGHPIAATGTAQIYEIVKQLRDQAGPRQVAGARVGITHNGGGMIGIEPAAMALHIFNR